MDMKAAFAVVNYTSSDFSIKGKNRCTIYVLLMVTDPRQIRRLGVFFSGPTPFSIKKSQPGAYTEYAPG